MSTKLNELLQRIEDIEEQEPEWETEYDEGFIDGVMASFDGELIDEKVLDIKSIPVLHHTKPGTAGEKPATIAKRIMSQNKTLKQAMAAIQFFINRRGVDISKENFNNAIAAQKIIAKAFAKKNKKKK